MKKIILIVSTILLLGFSGWYSKSLYESAAAGTALGKYRDQASCVSAVTRGNNVCKDKSCFLNNRYFFRACMDSARYSDNLCAGIRTSFGNLFAFEAWTQKQCTKLHRTDRGCHHIWQSVVRACDVKGA